VSRGEGSLGIHQLFLIDVPCQRSRQWRAEAEETENYVYAMTLKHNLAQECRDLSSG